MILGKGSRLVKRYIAAAFMLAFLPSCITSTQAAKPAVTADGKLAKPFFWSVSSHEKPAGFLLGTVHVAVDARKELPASVWKAFQESDCFVMEADQDAMDSQAVLAMAKQPAGKRLSQQLKPATWEALTKRLQTMVPAPVLDGSQAWFAGLAYMQTLLPRDVPPMDGVLLADARKAGKKVQFLEDWREAMTAFAGVTTAEDLEDIVGNDAESKKELEALVMAYRSGSEASIEGAIRASNERGAGAARAAEKEKALLEGRNKAWLPRLAKILREGKCFVAVGAGHLVGAKGLPKLLEGEGYALRRQD